MSIHIPRTTTVASLLQSFFRCSTFDKKTNATNKEEGGQKTPQSSDTDEFGSEVTTILMANLGLSMGETNGDRDSLLLPISRHMIDIVE